MIVRAVLDQWEILAFGEWMSWEEYANLLATFRLDAGAKP